MKKQDELREQLAALCHEMWSGWMEWMFTKECGHEGLAGEFVIHYHKVERWKRQMFTAYKDLPEEEKKSDRVEADKILKILEELDAGNGAAN